MPRSLKTFTWILALTLVVLLSYWKIVFTKQFSILWQWEMVSQNYAWYSYVATWIQKGILPLWDPFRYAGNSFIGEMQPGLFYPFKLALYLAPIDGNGLLSERAFHLFHVFSHWLAAVSMFFLARYLKLAYLPALVAGICFGLGGFVQWTAWPNILDAMAWLPLIVLFVLRAFDSSRVSHRLINASAAGLALGMTILAGSIHIALMDAVVVATLSAYLWTSARRSSSILSAVTITAVVALVSILFGAVQLLPSLEYNRFAYRWVGADAPIRSFERIPYSVLAPTSFAPRSLFAFVLGEVDAGPSDMTPYFGVLPLILAIIGIWKYWRRPLIPYLAALAAFALVYSWGALSFLHGLLYLAPYLETAREADRFIYLTHFAMAVTAGFGVQWLFEERKPVPGMLSVMKWTTIAFALLLAAASLGFPISVTEKTYLSFFFIAAALGLMLFLNRARKVTGARVVLIFLIAWDLYSFGWMIQSKVEQQKANGDAFAQLVYDKKLADFIKAQPGMPRVHFDMQGSPNIGNAYGVPVTWAMSATMLTDYSAGFGYDRQRDLLGVRFTVRPKEVKSSQPVVYSDDAWNVYENGTALPRAWIVHRVEVDASQDRPLKQVLDSSFDLSKTAIVEKPLESPIEDVSSGTGDSIRWTRYEPNRIELDVTAGAAGLLMLGEVFYPGWTARVDGAATRIYKADGLIRAVSIGKGNHHVSLAYEPASVRWGAILTVLTFVLVAAGAVIDRACSQKPSRTRLESID